MSYCEISGFPNYLIQKNGDVWSVLKGKFLKPYLTGENDNNYKTVKLYKNKKGYNKRIHRLLLETFIGQCPQGMQACHNNGDRLDNRLSNLRWDTQSNNQKDSIQHGTASCIRCGEDSSNHRLIEQDVLKIRRLWWDKMQTMKDITKLYNVHYSTINRIINRRTWKHI